MNLIDKHFSPNEKIRIFILKGQEWFVANDIASLLKYKRERDAITQHCKNAVSFDSLINSGDIPLFGLHPKTKLILEPDVWRLIIKSEMPEAEKIEKWIMEEVLPSIRKTGSYSISQQTPEKPHQNDGFDIKLYTQQSREIFELVQLINSQNSKTLYFADNLYKNLNIQSPLELLKINLESYYFIPTELGKFINASPVEMNKILEFKGFQTKQNGAWKLTEKGRSFAIEVQNGSFLQIKWKLKAISE
jgi:prophage antirepressor-like protein